MKKNISLLIHEFKIIFRGTKLINEYLGKGYLFLKICSASLKTLTPFISIYMTGRIIDLLSNNENIKYITSYVFYSMSLIFLLDIATRIVNRKCLIMLNSCWYKHEALLTKKALSLDYAKVESSTVSSLRAKISESARSNDTGVIWLAECIANIISNVLSVFVSITILFGMFNHHIEPSQTNSILYFVQTPMFSLILIVSVVILIIISAKLTNKNFKVEYEANNYSNSAVPVLDYYMEKILNENESGKDIRIFNEKALILNEIKKMVTTPFEQARNAIFKSRTTHGAFSVAITAVIGGLVYIFVGLKALAGTLAVGKVVEYYAAITKLIASISSLISDIAYLKNNNSYLNQELEYLDLPSNIESGTLTLSNINLNTIEIEFKNVSFKYPNANTPILKNISLKINSQEKLAIVGTNGSGKTTLIKLLCRLYEPTEGKILINGFDISEFNYHEYLKLFSIVFQDFKLLAFPVGENVSTNENYDEQKVWNCLEMAGIKERIEKFPKGLNQSLYKLYEKDGIDISGGEEQKIALARALYKDAAIVILDEPTAALDPISESEIYNKFNEIVNHKTAIYISHRLSSCRFCDRIIVLDNGSVIQEGTHNELVNQKNGKYFELWFSQAKHYLKN